MNAASATARLSIAVVIASAGRPDTLAETLAHLARQHRAPDLVVLSLCGDADGPAVTPGGMALEIVHAPRRGSCAQRNAAIARVAGRFDIVTFLDDDFIPSDTYFDRLERLFLAQPDISVLHGLVVADGARTQGYSFQQGVRLLEAAAKAISGPGRLREHPGAYGCNMSVRAAHIGDTRFDERLALHGWQEDIDFTARVGRAGRIVSHTSLIGVHLGIKSGRVSDRRVGYSQIVNPIYLVRKGTMPIAFATRLVARNLVSNAVRSLRPEPWVDRRGRLYGNMVGIWHVVRGRIAPEAVEQV